MKELKSYLEYHSGWFSQQTGSHSLTQHSPPARGSMPAMLTWQSEAPDMASENDYWCTHRVSRQKAWCTEKNTIWNHSISWKFPGHSKFPHKLMGSVRRCIKTGFHQLTDRSFTLLNCFLDNEFISYAEVKKLQLGIRAQLFEGRLALPKGSIDNWVSIFVCSKACFR